MGKPDKDGVERQFGLWWQEGGRDGSEKVPGTLERHPDGRLVLRLSGQFSQRVQGGEVRIGGYVGIGNPVSLRECHVLYSEHFAMVPRQDWHVGLSVVGVAIQGEGDWTFSGATFEMPGVTRWALGNQFETKVEGSRAEGLLRFVIAAEQVSKCLWSWGGIDVRLANHIGTDEAKEVSIELHSRMDVVATSEAQLPLEDYQRAAVFPMQVLIALSTGEFTCAKSAQVKCFLEDEGAHRYFECRWHPHSIPGDPGCVMARAFSLSDVEALGVGRLQAWVDQLMRIETVGRLYVACLGGGVGFAELRFQLVVQALEAYHRDVIGGKLLSDEEWKEVLLRLQSAIGERGVVPKPHRVIRSKLKGLNGKTLQSRLEELFELVGIPSSIGGEDWEALVGRVSNTRNTISHGVGGSADAILRGEQLVHATQRLIALLEILLLRDLGFRDGSQAWGEVLRRRVKWLPAD
jgi:hypothetical protein